MERHSITTAALVLLLFLAGCGGADSPGSTPPATSATTDGQTQTPNVVTKTVVVTPTPSPIPGPTAANARVTFPDCTSFRVEAARIDVVLAAVEGGETVRFEGNFSGVETFETDAPVSTVVVSGGGDGVSRDNPDYAACIGAEPDTTPTPDYRAMMNVYRDVGDTSVTLRFNKSDDGVPDLLVIFTVERRTTEDTEMKPFIGEDGERLSYRDSVIIRHDELSLSRTYTVNVTKYGEIRGVDFEIHAVEPVD